MFKTRTSVDSALQKLKHFCGYQERAHREVREKLFGLGLRADEVDQVVARLIEEDYLNESRFAEAFAGGKFRVRGWGKMRIRHEMLQRGVSKYCIDRALASIPEDDYRSTFEKLAHRKWVALAGERSLPVKKSKWQNYLLQKGYESSLFSSFQFPASHE